VSHLHRPLFVLVLLSSLSGCGSGQRLPADARNVLEKADEIELYSINPDKKAKKEGQGLRGWEVLGQTTLSGDEKKKIVQALLRGIASSDGSAAACFNPRHGITATYDGKTVELVICYECLSMSGWTDGEPFSTLTARGPEGEFNRVLEAKGIKVAE
jgi:hypothetical protein